MDSLLWMSFLTAVVSWVVFTEIRDYLRKTRFEYSNKNCLARFILTFSDGSTRCLDDTSGLLNTENSPILKTFFNQEYWIVTLHLEHVPKPEIYPAKLYLHVDGVGKVPLRKDHGRPHHVMYRAKIHSALSLHYVSRKAVIGA